MDTNQKNLIGRRYASPCGPMTLMADGDRLVACLWGEMEVTKGESAVLDKAVRQLDEYFAGVRTVFDAPFAMHGTEFRMRVWRALTEIPYGEVKTYGQLAAELGMSGGARAIGNAVSANPLNFFIPCHRVVPSAGGVGGYEGGTEAKRFILALERETKEKCDKKSIFSLF